MNLQNLKELGLSDGEIKVYIAVLELGISSLNKIQEKTGIERRNIYDILNKLIEKGFVSYTVEKGKKTYQCTHPNRILAEIQSKKDSLEKLKKEVPKIEDLFNAVKPKVRAEVYRGNQAMKTLLYEMLEHKEHYWIGGNSGVESEGGEQLVNTFLHWNEERIKRKIMLYDLVDNGTYLKEYPPQDLKKHKKEFYKRCELPKDLASPMIIAIFGDKVAQILWNKQSFAFVLESREIKDSFMKYFNYFWKNPY